MKIYAVTEIDVTPNSSISPDITLAVGKFPIPCNQPLNPVLQNNLSDYCHNNSTLYPKYKANIFGKTAWFHLDNNPIQKLREEYGITFNPYPNPSKNTCAIDFTLKKDETVTISIFDVTGKSIYKVLDDSHYTQGRFTVPVNMDLLENGIYFCTFTTNDGYTETKKIVVAK